MTKQTRLISRPADLILLDPESRSRGLFSPASILVAIILGIGGPLAYFVNVFAAAGIGIILLPFILYWESRSVAKRIRRAGVLDDLESTVHGKEILFRHFDSFCNHFASRALFAVMFVYLASVLFQKNYIAYVIGMLIVGAMGGAIFYDAAQAGKADGLGLNGSWRIFRALKTVVTNMIVVVGLGVTLALPLLWLSCFHR